MRRSISLASGASLLLRVALAGLAACDDPPPRAPIRATSRSEARASRRAPRPLSLEELRAIVDKVSAGRQLGETERVQIEQLPAGKFGQLVREELSGEREDGDAATAEQALLVGFDLLPPPSARKEIASAEQVLNEQIVGFYHKKRKRLYVRTVSPDDERALVKTRAILAHEIYHALQAQHFKTDSPSSGDDAALAHLALIEGDAMVAMGAYLGTEYGAPVHRTLRQITDVIEQSVKVGEVADDEGSERKLLDRALPLTRARLLFPYDDGMRFVTDLYRAGGFELVNKVYDDPPRTTAEVLHPEKYLAGLAPAVIGEWPLPSGYKLVASGALGELQTRVVLERCNGAEQAARAAAGWSGDRFATLLGPDHRLAMMWLSAWENDAEAKEFAGAVVDKSCWQDNEVSRGGLQARVGRAVAVFREGDRVAVVRGLGDEAGAAVKSLLAVQVSRAAPAKRGDFRIPPRDPLPKRVYGAVRGDVYRNEWLGIHGRVPGGMSYDLGSDGEIELTIHREGGVAAGVLGVSDRIVSEEFNGRTFDSLRKGLQKALAKDLPGRRLLLRSSKEWRSDLGRALERTWRVEDTRLHMRGVLIPICAGTGSLVFLQIYGDDFARKVLDGWFDSFRWITTRNAPVCERLDPK